MRRNYRWMMITPKHIQRKTIMSLWPQGYALSLIGAFAGKNTFDWQFRAAVKVDNRRNGRSTMISLCVSQYTPRTQTFIHFQ